MKHHEPSGMFYNWYDEATGEVITTWPEDGSRVYPFLSSVDNGWLGAALMVVRTADRGAAPLAARLFDRMRWDMFYDADTAHPGVRPGGLIHGGFYDAPPPAGASTYTGNHIGVGPDVWYTNHHYDTTVSETRITSYLGILTGQIPAQAVLRHVAHLPGDLRLVVARDAAGRARTAPTWGSTSTRAPTPTAACTSSRAGAAACSRS